jgi:hypothetical protein
VEDESPQSRNVIPEGAFGEILVLVENVDERTEQVEEKFKHIT